MMLWFSKIELIVSFNVLYVIPFKVDGYIIKEMNKLLTPVRKWCYFAFLVADACPPGSVNVHVQIQSQSGRNNMG